MRPSVGEGASGSTPATAEAVLQAQRKALLGLADREQLDLEAVDLGAQPQSADQLQGYLPTTLAE